MAGTFKIVLIGSGNAGTQLGHAFSQVGHQVLQVYSKTIESAKILANQLDAAYTNELNQIDQNADFYIIAIKDDAINKIPASLNISEKIIAHTAGSVPMEVLKDLSPNFGIFYPLQTLSKDKTVDFTTIPICIEGSNHETLYQLKSLAESLSTSVQEIHFEKRKMLHLSAVFVCNFTNHMYTIASDLLKKEGLSFDLILPLIRETTEKLNHVSPVEGQTGPAIRNDQEVIEEHLGALEENEDYQNIYKLLTESIQKKN